MTLTRNGSTTRKHTKGAKGKESGARQSEIERPLVTNDAALGGQREREREERGSAASGW